MNALTDSSLPAAARPIVERLRPLLELAPDAMLVVDGAGTILHASARAESLFGYGKGELVGRVVEDLVPESLRAAHARSRREYAQAPHARPMGAPGLDLRAVRRDGASFPAEISLCPVELEGEMAVVAAIRDVTERREAARALQRAHDELDERVRERTAELSEANALLRAALDERNRALEQLAQAVNVRDEFLSIASHELRTPLSALGLHVESLLHGARQRTEPAGPPPRLTPKLEVIARQVERLDKLIGDLLDVSRIGAGRLELERESVELHCLVDEVVARFESALAAAGCRIVRPVDAPGSGSWDRSRIDQVLTNLLSNAIKYGAGQPIEVSVEVEADFARLTVRDRGIGIAPEDRARVFGRFERLVSTRHYGGLGLGLWIARQIVEAHGGSIQVSGEAGAGSTFVVELPREPGAR
ncbi:MAG: PAS domain-containing sensor histidine kinase [Deltaproteobacteria bacterium]|nr:PAS domain-containing sensor histidine kinase [Deltaproteobacteria bacterium]